MHFTTGTLVAIEPDASGEGWVSVRGARSRVALGLLPEAKPGDTLLVHAGAAIAIVRDGAANPTHTED